MKRKLRFNNFTVISFESEKFKYYFNRIQNQKYFSHLDTEPQIKISVLWKSI